MKKILSIIVLAGIIAAAPVHADIVNDYKRISDDLNIIQVYDTNDLNYEILANRDGEIIIERIIGQVIDSNGNGVILNTDDNYYNYISYKRVKGAQKGDVILTYCVYNPDTQYEDDIIDRFDYIIDRTE